MNRLAPLFAAALASTVAGCGGALPVSSVDDADLSVVATLQPQTFAEGTVSDRQPQLSYAFNGSAGDYASPDAWPTAGAMNGLVPTLTLLGPKGASGHRSVIAHGTARDTAGLHLGIDGVRLPSSGNYLVVVGQAATGKGGKFTLRFWTNASHAPRPENAQLDLSSHADPATVAAIRAHYAGGPLGATAWADAEVDGIIAGYLAEPDLMVALSSAHELALGLTASHSDGLASDAQVARSNAAAARLVGDLPTFAARSNAEQGFALYWLGRMQQTVFTGARVDLPASAPGSATHRASGRIDTLIASWPGAAEAASGRSLTAMMKDGVVYGYVADWECDQHDSAGDAVFAWFSTDLFNSAGTWLGESSAGASESDDD